MSDFVCGGRTRSVIGNLCNEFANQQPSKYIFLPCKVQDQPPLNRRKSRHIFFSLLIKHCARRVIRSPKGQGAQARLGPHARKKKKEVLDLEQKAARRC